MKRREFITLLGGAAAWPRVARAQQSERMRRIGVLMHTAADDPEGQTRVAAFLQGLQEAGWAVGHNVRVDTRWATADADSFRTHAAELLALAPDVVLASTSQSVAAFQKATSTLPIVFVGVVDPVAQGVVDNLARPSGNITGFVLVGEFSLSAKWLERMKQVAPAVTRVAVIRDPTAPTSLGQFRAIQSMAQSLGVEVSAIGIRDAAEIERAIREFASRPNGGLIATAVPQLFRHRALIIALAERHRLPTVFPFRVFVADGGLTSYGANAADSYRRAAAYVDRILKGAKPAELPVQLPTKFELVINLRTAKILGLSVPPALLARADEVIE
jgi:putative tryptophan/tyrosine transport system substrate-binding protein